MSKVAARQPGGRERIKAVAASKDPQAVGKLSGFMPWLTEKVLGLFLGKDMSWIIQILILILTITESVCVRFQHQT